MAKNNITQYDATAANNTDIDSINIDEGMAASDVNNAIRSLMSHLKNVDTGSQALTALSVTGNVTVAGDIQKTSGDLTLDVAGDIVLDADGGDVTIKDGGSSIGAITNTSSDLSIYSLTGNHKGLRFGNGQIVPTNNAGADSDNTTDLGGTSNRFKNLYLSGGVYLGGTGSANYLDDYEEGTFTPTLISSSGGSRAVDGQVSRYTKIGRICYISCAITTIGALSGSNTGTVRLGGLPFNYNGSVSKSVTSSVSFVNVNLPAGIVQTAMLQNSSGSSNNFFFSSTFDDSTVGELGISAFDHTSSLVVSLVYEVA